MLALWSENWETMCQIEKSRAVLAGYVIAPNVGCLSVESAPDIIWALKTHNRDKERTVMRRSLRARSSLMLSSVTNIRICGGCSLRLVSGRQADGRVESWNDDIGSWGENLRGKNDATMIMEHTTSQTHKLNEHVAGQDRTGGIENKHKCPISSRIRSSSV
ncbi:uncharacterized protein EI90DRAFT_3079763 [Cantharellus anzutake]|uniref:uncharacterized protein n=1 Tax=Cantharellus anzutake TaxID=1750568 RepID=UPI0019050117|nr:uncharacterized protein EI90DRAFT_3079763 [Cantharellus anzutake]KAF8320977.1 hypothetical protein EI90DRAFT_3079763 [Cantharellus anzutake]